ncbi:STR-90 protein [Aphelenchoides avenae]|nr:STR-90 protein [Aphelenchus avenae]
MLALGGADGAAYAEAERLMSSIIGDDSPQTTLQGRLFVMKYTEVDLDEILFLSQCVLAMIVGYALIFFCQYKVFRTVRAVGPLVNRKTQRLQSDLHKALLALAAGPLLAVVIPGCAYSAAMLLRVDMGRASPYILLPATAITLVNPLTTLFFVRPFRRAISRVLSCRTRSSSVYASSVHFAKDVAI